jgi:hypothetical protein
MLVTPTPSQLLARHRRILLIAVMTTLLGEELDWEYPFLLLAFIFLCQSLEFFLKNGTRNPLP